MLRAGHWGAGLKIVSKSFGMYCIACCWRGGCVPEFTREKKLQIEPYYDLTSLTAAHIPLAHHRL